MISDEVKTIISSITTHTQNSAKIWAAAATAVLIVISADLSDKSTLSVFGITLEKTYFFLYMSTALSSMNIAFLSSELQGQRLSRILREHLNENNSDDKKFTEKSTVKDVILSLHVNAYNRVYSLTHYVPKTYSDVFYLYIKLPLDVVYFGLPIFGSITALLKGADIGKLTPTLFVFAIALSIVSLATTLIAISASIKLVYNQIGNFSILQVIIAWSFTITISYIILVNI